MNTIGVWSGPFAQFAEGNWSNLETDWNGETVDLAELSALWSSGFVFEIEPNGGIGDGAGPIPQPDETPIPVEPDGGIGDGAGPIPDGDETPIPVEPDGGIGDGAGPIPDGDETVTNDNDGSGDVDGEVTILPFPLPEDPDNGGPIPVEPDGGIGDGAGPILEGGEDEGDVTILPFPLPTDPDDGDVTILPYPLPGDDGVRIPVEPDGGIGDGADPIEPVDGEPIPIEGPGGIGDGAIGIPENNIEGGGAGTTGNDFFYATEEADAFIFKADHGYDMIHDFDVEADSLVFTDTGYDFTDLESLLEYAKEDVMPDGTVIATVIETGDSSALYLDGISINDLQFAQIDF